MARALVAPRLASVALAAGAATIVACNALVGLDEGLPRGQGGASASSSVASSSRAASSSVASSSSSSSSSGSGGAGGAGGTGGEAPVCPITTAMQPVSITCGAGDPLCQKQSAWKALVMTGALVVTNLALRTDGSMPNAFTKVPPDEYLANSGFELIGSGPQNGTLEWVPSSGGVPPGVSYACGGQACSSSTVAFTFTKLEAAVAIVTFGKGTVRLLRNGKDVDSIATPAGWPTMSVFVEGTRFDEVRCDFVEGAGVFQIGAVACP